MADKNAGWSFGRKIGLGFALVLGLAMLASAVTIITLRDVVAAKDRVLEINARGLVTAQQLETTAAERIAALRGFLLTSDPRYVEELTAARGEFGRLIADLLARRAELAGAIARARAADAAFRQTADRIAGLARSQAAPAEIERVFQDELKPRRLQLESAIDGITELENESLEAAQAIATTSASNAVRATLWMTGIAILVGVAAATTLTRALARQIAQAVSQVQSSSAELQAAANQQAAGLREQALAITEITTTISELLTTSRQIAESAQRVAQMASQTGGSARTGDETVARANESFASIQRQVELIVHHMLELGRKSQQIGTVLEIVAELAEQTNILAINASIEASGAGEAGRRFAVVADEIRKLADRVGGSTKEIRSLIDEVRSAVNTTVMATETGSKTVEAGSRQFTDVAASLRQITGLVGTTTEAAREIELSTKQQSTAVEQVNLAIANVAQASRETEESAKQTLQTAAELAVLSRNLLEVVQPTAA